jgi:hypothetical protein
MKWVQIDYTYVLADQTLYVGISSKLFQGNVFINLTEIS